MNSDGPFLNECMQKHVRIPHVPIANTAINGLPADRWMTRYWTEAFETLRWMPDATVHESARLFSYKNSSIKEVSSTTGQRKWWCIQPPGWRVILWLGRAPTKNRACFWQALHLKSIVVKYRLGNKKTSNYSKNILMEIPRFFIKRNGM